MVIGDFMLDTYTEGRVKRISPEAPVAVLNVVKQHVLPGGAGNVVLNLASLGAYIRIIGRLGWDDAGKELKSALSKENIDLRGFYKQRGFETPVKNRIIAENQHIVRIDFEKIAPLSETLEQRLIENLPLLLESIQVIAISDYGKGFLTPSFLSAIFKIAKSKRIPVIVDPKGTDFSKYNGATIIKPNVSEAYKAATLEEYEPLENVAKKIISQTQVSSLLITRSHQGITVFDKKNNRQDFPVKVREVNDVTGAGDTVLAVIAMAIANSLSVDEAAKLANFAAGIAVEHLGCARVSLADLANRLLESDCHNKVFEEEYLLVLQAVLQNQPFILLGIRADFKQMSSIIKNIKKLASEFLNHKLIIYIQDTKTDPEFIELLASLVEVDFIVLQHDNLKQLSEKLHPEKVYVINNDKIICLERTEILLN